MDVYKEEVSLQGRPTMLDAVRLGQTVIVRYGRLPKIARLKEEWFEDVDDPESVVRGLRDSGLKADIFTFCQRLPDTVKKYPYYAETEKVAAIKIETYEHWFKNQIDTNARRAIKKAEKKGVVVRETVYDDEFVKGMTAVFNETPIRQGKPFWHYGKDFQTVKKQFSRYLFREDMIGAYCGEELIGFIMLCNAGTHAELGQILSKIEHRDKSPNNALIAKAVEVCARKKIPYLAYGTQKRGNWGEFPRRNGFEIVELPRYFVPLTRRGKLLLQMNLHHGIKGFLPEEVILRLIDGRRKYYEWRYGDS